MKFEVDSSEKRSQNCVLKLKMKDKKIPTLLFAFACSSSYGALSYVQNFEGYNSADVNALQDGWLVGANVFDSTGTNFLYNYFAFQAPNLGSGFSGVAVGEGGPDQGAQQLNTFNDYNNTDHTNGSGNRIQANIFRDIGTIGPDDVGETVTFTYDVKQGNIGGDTTATAFLKVLKTSDSSFADLALNSNDTTATGATWNSGSLSLVIDAAWVGETLQIGFTNTADNSGPSGVFYDNIVVAVPEPSSSLLSLLALVGMLGIRKRR